jgi:NADH dehydrogenase [ubiquinone] 1 alpha subcomplex assembly factor 3
MDIFASSQTAEPAQSIDACTAEGAFHLSNGTRTPERTGVMLLGGEAFLWRPWNSVPESEGEGKGEGRDGRGKENEARRGEALLDKRGMLVLPPTTLGLLASMYPRPDLLLLGTGERLHPLHPTTKNYLMSEVGIRVDVMDTANAAAAYNLLATERGLEAGGVGAALFPLSWRG